MPSGTSSKAKTLAAAVASWAVSATGVSVAGASPSRERPSRMLAGIALFTAMPRDTATTLRPRSLARRLKCAAHLALDRAVQADEHHGRRLVGPGLGTGPGGEEDRRQEKHRAADVS